MEGRGLYEKLDLAVSPLEAQRPLEELAAQPHLWAEAQDGQCRSRVDAERTPTPHASRPDL